MIHIFVCFVPNRYLYSEDRKKLLIFYLQLKKKLKIVLLIDYIAVFDIIQF